MFIEYEFSKKIKLNKLCYTLNSGFEFDIIPKNYKAEIEPFTKDVFSKLSI